MTQKPSMSITLNCESAVNTSTKKASLPIIPLKSAAQRIIDIHMVSGVSKDHRPQHGLQWRYRAWTSTQLHLYHHHVPWSSTGCRHPHGPERQHGTWTITCFRQQQRPRISMWPLLVTQAMDINKASGHSRTKDTNMVHRGSQDNGHQHGLWQ